MFDVMTTFRIPTLTLIVVPKFFGNTINKCLLCSTQVQNDC